VNLTAVAVVALALGAGVYYSICAFLIHYSFHSFGWDLGIFDQVLWSLASGHGFHYSFRDMPYLGDHFQPMLVLLAPLAWLELGPTPILALQGLAFGLAVIPLHAATRRLGGPVAAWGLSAAYILSLGVARAVSYDFHPECFAPFLVFTALWAMMAERPGVFVASSLALLPLKEDMALLALALCWVAWLGFGWRRQAQWVGLASVAYMVAAIALMRLIADGQPGPLTERYPYLGDSPAEIALHALTRPDLIAEHLWNGDTPRTLLYLLAGAGFLPLLRPALLPPLALLLLPPLLAVNDQQRLLELHYGVVPYAFAVVLAAMAVQPEHLSRFAEWLPAPSPLRLVAAQWRPVFAVGIVVAMASVMFAWKSPLPPSFAADWDRFEVDHHADVAASFVDMVPSDAVVSAQANFVPHLSQRRDIYEFPRITGRATYVLVDDRGAVPGYDWPAYNDCRAKIPLFGFALVREEDGIQLWQRSAEEAARYGSDGCG
jgi:uncharacterized membrane protein